MLETGVASDDEYDDGLGGFEDAMNEESDVSDVNDARSVDDSEGDNFDTTEFEALDTLMGDSADPEQGDVRLVWFAMEGPVISREDT